MKLKQRVTGAIVLVALAIIILPMLLDGSEEDRARVIASMPEPPMVELDSLTLAEMERGIDEIEAEGRAAMPDLVEDTTDYSTESSPDALTLDANQLPVSWSLQLASFQNQDNALRLRQSLRDADYKTYILQASGEDGDLYRVFVGPMIQRSRLTAIGEQIEARFELKGRIVRYDLKDDARQLGG